MVGPSVFPEKQVIPKCLVLQYFQIHGSKNLETQYGLFRTDFKSETTSKYILDIP